MPKRPIDSRLDFLSPVSLVPGLGPKRIAALKASGIETIRDLLYHFPRRYIDRSTIVAMQDLSRHVGETCSVIGTVTRTRVERGRRARLRIQLSDDTGSIEALWFAGVHYYRKTIHTGQRLLCTGTVGMFNTLQMVHPLIEPLGAKSAAPAHPYLPWYPITEAMREVGFLQKPLFKAVQWVLANLKHYPQLLPQKIEQKKNFPPLQQCLRGIHMPEKPADVEHYRQRLRYEELYELALALRWSKRKFALPGRAMHAGALAEKLEKSLPFALSDEQKKAIKILYGDAAEPKRMHRLCEGDVGSGKTIVAFFACLPALNEGMQVAWMAPTEVLAQQSFNRIRSWLELFGVEAGLLKRGVDAEEKRRITRGLSSGTLPFVVGTHALLQPSVKFSSLAMIVIDEQHKFGAQQRLRLAEKDPQSDFLLMSATPIPQTLAKTLYGDLDIVTIGSLPHGRQPVRTHIVPEAKRADMQSYISRECMQHGAQVFYLVPRIDVHEDDARIKDIQTVFNSLNTGALGDIRKEMIHGKMSGDEKARIMHGFESGEIQLLVATTLVEVGIDVPNATIMVIENAERFGLSQLHQLRGRAARGTRRGYCFLLPAEALNEQSTARLKKFCATHDGFEIADYDLDFRGPGDIVGFRQSGWDDLKVADILNDAGLFREIQQEIDTILGS
jgi:ATP-dependent DNA helicase RecG